MSDDHVCAADQGCRCSMSAVEPHPDCPIHGYPWPPRCAGCGKFLKWPTMDDEPDCMVEVEP